MTLLDASSPSSSDLLEASVKAKAWPFEEARRLLKKLERSKPKEGPVLFETGYGPSGLPHIGTFGEVSRTLMVQHAFQVLTDHKIPTKLICFSDDMDGLRKVPENVPNKNMLAQHLEKPLTQVPDPFGTHDSFGTHNNARLQAFLDQFGFDYDFISATDMYKKGAFDQTLIMMARKYDKILDIILPTLGEERRATYAPFLPLCPHTGKVLQVALFDVNAEKACASYKDPETNETITTPLTGGRVKCQWKADWAMRWAALGVDYEMAGKDLIDSVKLSSRICKAIGGKPPEGFNYELFLDEKGQKISKSKGNGLTIEEWLRYASPESLSLFMFQKPKTAKRLHFDVIPKAVDDYDSFLNAYPRQDVAQKLSNPVWHLHQGEVDAAPLPVSFAMLLNLASASNTETADVLWGFLQTYRHDLKRGDYPRFDLLVDQAVLYYHDHVKPYKSYRLADDTERAALKALKEALLALPPESSAEDYQSIVYAIGRDYFPDEKKKSPDGKPGVSLRWFGALYQILLGQEKGPRFGSFVALFGVKDTCTLMDNALERSLK